MDALGKVHACADCMVSCAHHEVKLALHEVQLRSPLFDAFVRAGSEAGYGATADYNGCRQVLLRLNLRGFRRRRERR